MPSSGLNELSADEATVLFLAVDDDGDEADAVEDMAPEVKLLVADPVTLAVALWSSGVDESVGAIACPDPAPVRGPAGAELCGLAVLERAFARKFGPSGTVDDFGVSGPPSAAGMSSSISSPLAEFWWPR
jgi:hypothetical protein